MNILKPILTIALSIITFSSSASVIYTYTGNNFNSFTGSTFDSSMSVSGYIELNEFLAPNLINQSVNPLSYSFTDGVSTLTNSDVVPGGSSDLFEFYTDLNGNITMWDVNISLSPVAPSELGDTSHFIKTRNEVTPFTDEIIDFGSLGVCITLESGNNCSVFNVSRGEVSNNTGTWSVSTVPIPAAIWLFLSGIIGLLGTTKLNKILINK